MADLTGIENVGEFFSQHYLAELLEKDLASEGGDGGAAIEAAQKALGALGRELNKILTDAPLHAEPKHLYALAHPFQVSLCEALGFTYQSGAVLPLGDGSTAPALHVTERHGETYLAVIEGRLRAPREVESGASLELLWTAPLPQSAREAGMEPPLDTTLGEAIAHAFEVESPPRWILLLSGAEVYLAERARWGRGQYLRFDLSELLGRKDPKALRITAALLCRASLVPDGGTLLHDRLDESSHKHAQGVSADLKFAAREAVELLANEWVHYQRTTAKKALHGERVARELTEECLVYLYRLLVLFYVEARSGELGLLPMNSEEYARGYSLEALRDLEQVALGPESRDGFFFDESLRRLFRLVNEGFSGTKQLSLPVRAPAEPPGDGAASTSRTEAGKDQRGFRIEGLHSPLFDPRSTPRLAKVRLRNEVLQKVIRLLSLTPEARRGRGARVWGRGRISYAQLGINQLGAVYEGLLSYTGFFARERLYEVHRAGVQDKDATQQAWFVPERELVRYKDEELSFDEGGQKKRRKYEPGTFIYRLAGRDRESSASYYTPEVLTRCLVKYALRELLQGKSAEDILALTICEPAMGSGAFLVEAIDQLADAYLERRRKELGGIALPPDQYALEKQRVKSYLAEARCYGVDLNPMAARLAGVSLWLGTLHKGQSTPWYGARLAVGNSLVGARLEVWAAEDFGTDEALAKAIAATVKRHGVADDLEAQLELVLAAHEGKHPEAVAEVRSRLERVKRLAGAPAEGEEGAGEDGGEAEASEAELAAEQRKEVVKALKKLATELKLPRHHRRPPRKVEAKAVVAGERPAGSVWHFLVPDAGMSPFEDDKVVAELAPEAVTRLKAWRKDIEEPWSAVDVRRLQALSARVDVLYREAVEERRRVLAMCTPAATVWGSDALENALPALEKRAELLAGLKLPGKAYWRLERLMNLWAALWAFPLEHSTLLPKREAWLRALEEALGVDAGAPAVAVGQMSLGIWPTDEGDEGDEAEEEGRKGAATLWTAAEQSCARLRPFHWELVFPEVFVEGGGFDLVVGNPPWIKVDWNESGILSDMDPRIELDGLSASDLAKRRGAILSSDGRVHTYLETLTSELGYKTFVSAPSSFPLLSGVQPNLYKCFISQGWCIGSTSGIVALIHQDGLFDDPKGGEFRQAAYRRLRIVLRFRNEFRLFADVNNGRPYTLSVSGAKPRALTGFLVVANLFHPATVDASMLHDGGGKTPGIKSDNDEFEIVGHRNRLVNVGERELKFFATLFDRPGIPTLEARLPVIHSAEVVHTLQRLAQYPHKLSGMGSGVLGTKMWDETEAQKDGTIRRCVSVPGNASEWIVSGPHFFVGNPFNKSPRDPCRHNKDYDEIDLELIPDDYLPRVNYVPGPDRGAYDARVPRFLGKPMTDYYRHVNRTMLAAGGERTAIVAIVPPGPGHIDLVHSVCFERLDLLVECSALWSSLVVDFLVRSTGKGHLRRELLSILPIPATRNPTVHLLSSRALRLNCLTTHYADLWNDVWPQVATAPAWSISDPRLSPWPARSTQWHRHCALRNHFERRWALVEIDALAALELKLTIDELCTIYRTQFPVLREYEKNTWYDRNGRIAFTTNRGLTGVGLDRKAFELWQACLKEGKRLPDDFDRQQLEPPFDVRDREDDMRAAYAFFAERLASGTTQTPPARSAGRAATSSKAARA
ncbi:Eco57I restriction-modification methylase domain-containing protein [Sorangium sp. So ce117]|uniref:Eco57I restriction-modification methylase domain-containing protein n=1 Tax=Sorangium sp. So ce117 TaxID=3133277 RepID=UPI003F61E043